MSSVDLTITAYEEMPEHCLSGEDDVDLQEEEEEDMEEAEARGCWGWDWVAGGCDEDSEEKRGWGVGVREAWWRAEGRPRAAASKGAGVGG